MSKLLPGSVSLFSKKANLKVFVQDGWNYTHFVTPVSTLERDRYLSQPTLPTSPMRTSPVIVSGDSISSGCRMLRLKEKEPLC